MKYNRYLPLLAPVLSTVFLELFLLWPNLMYVFIVLAILLFFFVIIQFIKASEKEIEWWNLLILPSLFYVGLALFSAMITNRAIIQALFIVKLFFIYFYFRSLYYILNTDRQTLYSLDNMSAYGNFLTFYFIASSIYGLQSFLNLSVWLLMIFLLLAIWLIVYQAAWVNKVVFRVAFFYILVISLVLVELAWSISFLPLSFYILGLIMAVCYYMIIGLVRFYLREKLDKNTIKLYLIFGFSSILLVLLTASWM